MNIYIGCDIEEISRFEDKKNNKHFLGKIYTPKELEYSLNKAQSTHHLAVRFCAKEAVYKAVKQLDKSTAGWKMIEIIREKIGGRPHVILHQPRLASIKVSLSITHDGDYAWAVAIAIIQQ